jgi:hypothetical protein
MQLGTGIFLGCTILAVTILFIKTREKWNWRKIIMWALGASLSLAILSLTLLMLYGLWLKRLQTATSLGNITIGDKLSDIQFRMGGFEELTRNASDHFNGQKYINSDLRLSLFVKDNQVEKITYTCGIDHEHTKVNQVGCNDTGESIRDRYSDELTVYCIR